MEKLINFLKTKRINIPIWLGLLLNKIPYNLRPGIGTQYKNQRENIFDFSSFSRKEQEDFIYQHFLKIFTHAYNNIKFYQQLYRKHNIKPEDIRSFEDIKKVPIITKQDLATYDIEDRSYPIANRL